MNIDMNGRAEDGIVIAKLTASQSHLMHNGSVCRLRGKKGTSYEDNSKNPIHYSPSFRSSFYKKLLLTKRDLLLGNYCDTYRVK